MDWGNKVYDCEWFDKTNFEELKNVIQVYGFVFNDSKELCVINCKNEKFWCLPGGTVEKYDKTFEETLVREVEEEADLDIKDIVRVGYVRVIPRINPKEVYYLLRYVAKVKKIRNQSIDPAYGIIPQRKFINIKEFIKYTNWGENGLHQLKKAFGKLG